MVAGTAVTLAEAAEDDDEETTTTTTVVTSSEPSMGTSAPVSFLPCEPSVLTFEGVTYYRCGSQHYVEAIGAGGTVYMPVAPPG